MAVNITIPRTFTLVNREWKVEWITDANEGKLYDMAGIDSPLEYRLMGLCDAENAVIYLRKTKSKDSMMHTFLHELVHAMWAACSMGRSIADEERDADLIGGALHQFLKTKHGNLR